MELSVVEGRFLGSSFAHEEKIYQGAMPNHHLLHCAPVHLRPVPEGSEKCSSSPHQFCWGLPFDLEEARALATADANVVSDDDEEQEPANL